MHGNRHQSLSVLSQSFGPALCTRLCVAVGRCYAALCFVVGPQAQRPLRGMVEPQRPLRGMCLSTGAATRHQVGNPT